MSIPAAEWARDITGEIRDGREYVVGELATPFYSPEEVALVYDTLWRYGPDFICEWGTNVGHSARLFHDAAELLHLDCEIHSVEISPEVEGGRGVMVADRDVVLHVGDGPTVGLALCRDAGFEQPLFFLDDSHVYDGVLSQLEQIHAQEPGAVMLVHDTLRADLLGNWMLHDPGAAIRDFTARDEYKITAVTTGGRMMRLVPRL